MRPLSPPDPPLTDGVVVVRARRDTDADAVVRACQDPEIPRWTLVPSPYTHEDWKNWQVEAPMQEEAGEGLHMIIAGVDGELLGAVGVNSIDWERTCADIGYWVAPWARGRGVAARATQLVHAWARAELGLREVTLIIHADNAASQRVAAAAGFVDSGVRAPCPRVPWADQPDHIVFVSSS